MHGDPVGKAAQEKTENTECEEAALVQHCLLTSCEDQPDHQNYGSKTMCTKYGCLCHTTQEGINSSQK